MFKEIKNKFLRIFTIFIYFIIIFFCALELNFLWLFGYSPDVKDIKSPTLRLASEVYTADGKLIGRYYKENRTPVEFKDIGESVTHALIATEDARFYQHNGIDFRSLLSSLVSTAKGDRRGASTITQQLAKNLYRTRNNKSQGLIRHIPGVRTVVYKLKEWLTAYKLELQYDKNDLLTMYLNTVPFGNNTYGINTAAQKYFDKPTKSLKPEEAAMLIGMLKATTTYNPVRYPEKAKERRNTVLSQMAKYNYITKEQYQNYTVKPIKLKLGSENEGNREDSYLRNAVEKWLEKWCKENDYNLYEDGLKIYTTIDSKLQKYAQEAVNEQMKSLQRRFLNVWGDETPWRDSKGVEVPDFLGKAVRKLPWYNDLKNKYNGNEDSIEAFLNQKKKMKVFSWNGEKEENFSTMDSLAYYAKILNTGMMTLDPFNGHIKVWIGGINHNYFKYDHVKQSKRQAGSTFKPFAYLAALEEGMNPCDKFTDKPVTIRYKDEGKDEVWEPNNADFNFTYREMSLRWAMGKSVNSITAQITEKVGWDKVVEFAHKCGIDSKLKSVPSVSLGSNDVSVFEMVKAYGTFLNKGVKTEPILVDKITDLNNNLIADFKPKQERAISEEIAWLMLYMFKGGMEEPGGTSQALWEWDLWKKGNEIGGKTGTSSDYVDGWYMGITKDLVTGIWVGADDRSVHFKTAQTGEGSRTALPIFGKFMEKVYADASTGITQGRFPKPTEKITRTYNCPSPVIRIDTAVADSLLTDSLQTDSTTIFENEPVEEEQTEIKPAAPVNKPSEKKKEEKKVITPEKIDKKEERRQKREERRKEKQVNN